MGGILATTICDLKAPINVPYTITPAYWNFLHSMTLIKWIIQQFESILYQNNHEISLEDIKIAKKIRNYLPRWNQVKNAN